MNFVLSTNSLAGRIVGWRADSRLAGSITGCPGGQQAGKGNAATEDRREESGTGGGARYERFSTAGLKWPRMLSE